MAYRKLENVGERIIEAVIKIGSEEGIKKTTAAKVAKMCDVSDFTVLQFYGSKQGYIDAAAKSIDHRFMKQLYDLVEEGHSAEEVWDIMHDVLLQDPESVLYYNRYITTMGYEALDVSRVDEWLPMSKKLFGEHDLSDEVYLELWNFITTMALEIAGQVIRHPEIRLDGSRKRHTQLVFHGINSFFE